jgi:hypothetical protein
MDYPFAITGHFLLAVMQHISLVNTQQTPRKPTMLFRDWKPRGQFSTALMCSAAQCLVAVVEMHIAFRQVVMSTETPRPRESQGQHFRTVK